MEFFSSELGVAIAWICTISSLIFSLLSNNKVKKLKIQVKNVTNDKIKISNELDNIKAKNLDVSTNEVTQTGEKNIYTKQVTGGMKIDM